MTRLLLALLALVLLSDAAAAKLPCLTKSQALQRDDDPHFRKVPGLGRCWYVGERTPEKSEFVPQKTSLKKPIKSLVSSISEPEKADLDVNAIHAGEANRIGPTAPYDAAASASRRGGPAPEQARLAHTFQSITPTTWQTHIKSLSVLGIYRLEYRREFPAAWAMASRWP